MLADRRESASGVSPHWLWPTAIASVRHRGAPRHRAAECARAENRPERRPTVILSHHHGDHTGGLYVAPRDGEGNAEALERAYVGAGIFLSRPGEEGRESNETMALKGEYEAPVDVRGSRPADRAVSRAWLTGPVPRTYPERNWSGKRKIKDPDGRVVEDNIPEDMSLVLDTAKGLWSFRAAATPASSTRSSTPPPGPRNRDPRGPGGLPPLRGRCSDPRLDRRQAARLGIRERPRRPLHRDRGRVRASPAARTEPGRLRGRGGRSAV